MKKTRLYALTSLATISLATIVGCAKENLNTVPVNTSEPVASVSALSDADVENAMFDLVDLPAKEEETDAPKNDADTLKDLGLYVDNDETILTEEEKARRRQIPSHPHILRHLRSGSHSRYHREFRAVHKNFPDTCGYR